MAELGGRSNAPFLKAAATIAAAALVMAGVAALLALAIGPDDATIVAGVAGALVGWIVGALAAERWLL